MEFGPRALGGRRSSAMRARRAMQSVMNLKIKYRESFRPFAPSVLREDVAQYFETGWRQPVHAACRAGCETAQTQAMTEQDSRNYSASTSSTCPQSDIPAVTHVDYSARIQTVHPRHESALLQPDQRFKQLTGCGVIVNTTFNVRGEPIVCTPEDAYRCFMGTEMDELYVGNYCMKKSEQDNELRQEYFRKYDLD